MIYDIINGIKQMETEKSKKKSSGKGEVGQELRGETKVG